MRTLLLFLLALVAVGAELDYRLVVHKDGTERRGWWDPDTSILHMAGGKREWYDDRSVVARTVRIEAPADEGRPAVRQFVPNPPRYVSLYSVDATGRRFVGQGWLIHAGTKWHLDTDVNAPFNHSGGDGFGVHYFAEDADPNRAQPAHLIRNAMALAIDVGTVNPTR